ncbi:hypothetical protein CANARDRAFT_6764 [[Candida] arabinofermentans NRRL YB-2248]|uniref:MICOS complex subunit MIC60 n=1 Tax=[Candida] arabinofermentans NRRL YB-2248 TaxID=983967 RepID=A0A1E4T3G9_9ASCO|nr:hypothetical protein CANARDRAFT_6764 [[Candida] arabinofermentans NRRL YB-2248]
MYRVSSIGKTALPATRLLIAPKNQIRFQTTQAIKTAKRSHPVRNFLFKLSLSVITFYGVGAVVASKVDQLQDIFIDYVPFGEKALDTFEYYQYHSDELFSFSKINESMSEITDKLGLEKTVAIPKQGVSSDKVDASVLTKEIKSHIGAETTVESHSNLSLPLIKLKTGDATVDGTIDSLNEFIGSINKRGSDVESQKLVEGLNKNIAELSTKYKELLAARQGDVDSFLKEKEVELQSYFKGKEVSLTEEFVSKLTAAKQEIEDKYNARLNSEIKATKDKIMLEAENIIQNSKLLAIQEFNDVISQKIENERNGKLKNLDALASRVEEIEKFELELSQTAQTYHSYKAIKQSINNLEHILTSSTPSPKCGEALVAEIENLKKLIAPLHNELVDTVIDSLPSNASLLSSGGVLTQSQLIARWESLLPELRSVSLLPPNAGLMGHLSSLLFSKLLFSKTGSPVKTDDDTIGSDVESVIARVNDSLMKNQLDNAVEEVTNLKGVARQLVDDWLVESRKKLEIQFLVDIVETEIKISV